MKANELRIGNIVTINNKKSWPSLKGVEMVVIGISKVFDPIKLVSFPTSTHSICVEGNDRNTYNQFDQFIEPIPLTEEWLLRFGFKYIEECGYFADTHHCISETHKELDYWVFMPFCTNDEDCYIKIKYVHQLQNIYFALTGEELTP